MKKTRPLQTTATYYTQFLSALPPYARLAWDIAEETGLRISDILRLRRPQSTNDCSIGIIEKKTGKPRSLYFTSSMIRRMIALSGKTYVFERNGKPMHRDTIGKQIRKVARAFGMPEGVSMHSARKIFARRLYAWSKDVEKVQEALNHSHVETTLRYLFGTKEVTETELREPLLPDVASPGSRRQASTHTGKSRLRD